MTGFYYLDLEISDAYGGIANPLFGGGGTTVPDSYGGVYNPYRSELESWSVFGQVEYAISDDFSLVAGLRSVNDDKKYKYSSLHMEFLDPALRPSVTRDSNLVVLDTFGVYQGDRSDSELAYRLQLDWRASDASLAYMSYNGGVKGGGFNATILPPASFDDATMAYDPEQLDAYEIGYKTDIGNIGRLNLAAYYYDYKDYQAYVIEGIDSLIINADDSTSTGFKAELQLSPGDGWDILLGAAYNDAEVELPDGTKQVPVQSPKWNLNGMVRYAFKAMGGEVSLQADATYRDEVIFALTGTENVTQEAYTVANASVSYTTEDATWRFSAFVQNITDEEYLVQTFDLSGLDVFGMTEQYYGRPQWWGLSVRYNWGS